MKRNRTRYLLTAGVATLLLLVSVATASAEPWPYAPFNMPHPLGNHFGTYQNYGGSPYYHDGIDLVTPDGPVATYSVSDGTITHLTYNDPYYSGIMIGEPIAGGLGWLYWHIASTTFQYDIGDPVATNAYIGMTAWWPVAAFHHVHFNRVEGTGGYPWYWYIAIDNPLLYMEPHPDADPPTFPTTYQGDQFAFARQGAGTILDATALTGDVDIVARISDVVGLPQWELNPWRIDYWIEGAQHSVPPTNVVTFSGVIPANGTVSVIYRMQSPLVTEGDYDARIYYFIVTNTDGDGYVETTDGIYYWDTDLIDPGDYWVYVSTEDCGGNVVTESMMCTVAGAVDPGLELPEDAHDFGYVPVTLTDSWMMPIYNAGPHDLSVRSIASDDHDFTADRTHLFVAPGETEFVNVTFAPTEVRPYAATLTITTNDPLHPSDTVALTGVGGDPSAVPGNGPASPPARENVAGRLEILAARTMPAGAVEIDFAGPQAGELVLTAFDATGRRVREVTLRSGAGEAQSWTWDGCDQAGRRLPTGAYFLRLQHGAEVAHGVAMILR